MSTISHTHPMSQGIKQITKHFLILWDSIQNDAVQYMPTWTLRIIINNKINMLYYESWFE